MNTRKLYLVIMNYPGLPSAMIRLIKRCYFSHSSLGLDEDRNTFYSFVKKGYFVETLTRYLKPDRKPFDCELFEMEVSQAEYDAVRRELDAFARNRAQYAYAKIGIVLNMLGIPARFPNQYFCSHFIVEILSRAGVFTPDKPSVLYFPEDFRALPRTRMIFKGDLEETCRYLGVLPG